MDKSTVPDHVYATLLAFTFIVNLQPELFPGNPHDLADQLKKKWLGVLGDDEDSHKCAAAAVQRLAEKLMEE